MSAEVWDISATAQVAKQMSEGHTPTDCKKPLIQQQLLDLILALNILTSLFAPAIRSSILIKCEKCLASNRDQ